MSNQFDVVIVGAGIAGMSAALTVARLGHSTAVLSEGVPGGQLLSIEHIDGVPGFPEGVAGYDLCPMTQEQCDEVGVEFLTEECTAIASDGELWKLTIASGDVSARAVIIATGTALAKLDIPGELEFFGKGVSDCASCDGPLLRNKVAVVVGGGDSAMQEALALAEHVSKVIMISNSDELEGQRVYKERISAKDVIEMHFGKTVSEIVGEDGVTAVKVKDINSGDIEQMDTDAVFVFSGLVANTAFLDGLVSLDEKGGIVVDSGLRSSVKGLLAVGNVRSDSAYRAAGAMGDGAVAANAVSQYLNNGKWRETS